MNKRHYASPYVWVYIHKQADIVTASVTFTDGEFLMEDIFYET